MATRLTAGARPARWDRLMPAVQPRAQWPPECLEVRPSTVSPEESLHAGEVPQVVKSCSVLGTGESYKCAGQRHLQRYIKSLSGPLGHSFLSSMFPACQLLAATGSSKTSQGRTYHVYPAWQMNFHQMHARFGAYLNFIQIGRFSPTKVVRAPLFQGSCPGSSPCLSRSINA